MAHNFWFSYQNPHTSSSNSASGDHSWPLMTPHEHHKPLQSEEEKQKERQSKETRDKEQQKHLEIDAAITKREAREVHKLDVELLSQRRAQERERQAKIHQKLQTQQTHQASICEEIPINNVNQQQQPSICIGSVSQRESFERQISDGKSSSSGSGSGTGSGTGGGLKITEKRLSTDGVSTSSTVIEVPSSHYHHASPSSTIESLCKEATLQTGLQEQKSQTPSPKAIHLTLQPTIKPAGQFDPSRPRDDSTESDQSMPRSASQADGLQRLTCRAPIASLDCMEEFSGTGGHLDFGRSISLGSNPGLPIRHCTSATPGLRYKNLGKSGLRVSNVGLGTWSIFAPSVSEEQAETIIKLAMDSGINIFDLSEAHSGIRAEVELGKILQKYQWKRSSYVVTTKIYWSTKSDERGLSRKHIIESVQASLNRLQLSYIDIVIVHKADSMCPMEEIVRAMTYVISQGWAMYWGTARWSPTEIMEAYTNCRQFNCITPIVEQAEYHMFYREKSELYLPELYNKIGVGLMAWGPLGMCLGETQNGERLLFPKGSFKAKSHSYSWTEDELNKEERLEEGRRHCDKVRDLANLAEKLGCSAIQLSIAWSLKHEPVQCLLLGATSPEQLHQSLQALQLLPRLSTGVMLEIERILDNKPIRPPMISTLALR